MLLKDWLDSVLFHLGLLLTRRPCARKRYRSFQFAHQFAGVLQTMEDRTLLTTTISLSGDDLLIDDTAGGDTDDQITLSVSGVNVVVSDPTNVLNTSITGATGDGTNQVTVPLSAFTGDVLVRGQAGNDVIRINGFDPGAPVGLDVDGQAGFDTVFIEGVETDTGGGDVSIAGDQINVTASLKTGGGSVALRANQGVTLQTGADMSTSGGDFIVDADADNDRIGNYLQPDAATSVNASGGSVIIQAADVGLLGAITAGAGDVTLVNSVDGDAIELGTIGSVPIQTQLFFADLGSAGRPSIAPSIQQADVDGANLNKLHSFSLSSLPRDVAVDYTLGKLYWTDSARNTINRSNLDGSNVEVAVTLTSGSNPIGIDIDIAHQKVYWAERGNARIQRANVDGSSVESVITTSEAPGLDAPVDVAIDGSSSKVYWTDENTGLIQRANLDGSNVQTIVSGVNSKGIALDVAGGKLYYTHDASNKVIRADLDGGNSEDLVTTTNVGAAGISGPTGITVDVLGGYVYWADNTLKRVVRAPIDGGAGELIVLGTIINGIRPNGVAVTPTTIATFGLSNAELGAISTTGTLRIGNSGTGDITLVGDVTASVLTRVTTGSALDTNAAPNTFTAPTLEIVTGADIGTTHPVRLDTAALTLSSTSAATARLTAVTPVPITSVDLSGGALEIHDGEFQLSTDDAVTDTTGIILSDVNGAVFNLNGHDDVINVVSGGGSTGGELRLDTGTLMIGSTGAFELAGVITGDGDLAKQGAGQVTLSGSNTYSGQTHVNAGTVVITNASALGEADADSKTVVADGATLRIGNGAGATLTTGEHIDLHGVLSTDADTVTLAGNIVLSSGSSELSPTQAADVLTVSGAVSGTTGVRKSGSGTLLLTNATNSLSGVVRVDTGVLRLGASGALPNSAELALADTSGVLVDLNGFDSTISALNGGGVNGGDVALGNGTLTVNNSVDNNFGGVISGAGGLIKNEAGALTIDLPQAFTGNVSVAAGALVVNGALSTGSDVSVNNLATLTGGGTVPGTTLINSGGHLGGELTLANLALDTGANFNVQIDGTAPADDFNQTTVTTSIDLDANGTGGATLNVSLGFTPGVGDAFVIVDNTSASDVVNTFAGLPEAATLLVDGTPFEVSYVGGDGNDVELMFDTTPVINAGDINNIEVCLNGLNLEVVDTDTSNVLMSAPAADLVSLTINGEVGQDVITVQSLASSFNGTLILTGGDEDDRITFVGATDVGGGLLDLSAETVQFNASVGASSLDVAAQTVTQTAGITVNGTATFDVGSNDLTLSDVSNDFDTLSVTAANAVVVDDKDSLTLSGVDATGDLTVETGGALIVTSLVNVGGSLTVNTYANGGTGADVTDEGAGYFFAPTAVSFDVGTGQLLVDHPRTWIGPSDFGDARLPFPTVWSDVGANHPVSPSFRLGASIDSDNDGTSTVGADGDDAIAAPAIDDEDGVSFQSVLVRTDDSSTKASLVVTAALDGTTGFLSAWIDFNNDGNWNGANEQIVDGLQLNEGLNLLSVTVPPGAEAIGAAVTTRFRLSTWENVNASGFAQTGEVEDHVVTILDGSASPVDIDLTLPFAGTFELVLDTDDIVIRPESRPLDELLRVPEEVVNSINIIGTGGDDKLIVTFTGGNPLPVGGVTFDGQLQATETGDGIQIDGPVTSEFTRVTYTATDFDADVNTYDGSIEFVETDGTTRQLNFRDLEPILDNSNAGDRVFTIDSAALAGDVGIRLVDDAASGVSRIESTGSPGFEMIRFASPSNSLTINAGDGNNTVELLSLDASFSADVIINGQGGNDFASVTPSGSFAVSVFGGAPLNATSGDTLSVLASGTISISDVLAGDGAVSSLGNQDVAFHSLEDVVTSDARQLSVEDIAVVETDDGSTTATLTVAMSQPSLQDVSITVQSTDGEALAGIDYTQLNQTITILAGETSVDVALTVSGDEIVERDETLTVTFSNPLSTGTAPVLSSNPLVAEVTIENDDSATLTVGSVTPTEEGDSGSSQQVAVSVLLDHAVDSVVTIDLATLAGTATGGSDFISKSGTLSFNGTLNESQSFVVTIVGDDVVEIDESFAVVLSNLQASGRNVSLARARDASANVIDRTTIEITDDDSASVTIADAVVTEGDIGDARSLSLTVALSGAVQGGFDLSYSTSDGSAVAGIDFIDNDATLSFTGEAGETHTVSVQVNPDEIVEVDEWLTVALGAASDVAMSVAEAISIQTTSARGTITNDDKARISIADVTAVEGASGTTTDFTFAVTLDADVQGGLTVAYSTEDGTAKVASGDYELSQGSVSFVGARNETREFVVRVLNDDVVEADETFGVRLGTVSNITASADDILVAATPAKVTITDDDRASLTISDAVAFEGDPSDVGMTVIEFYVTLTGAVQDGLTVGVFSSDGTAVSGSVDDADYQSVQSTLSFGGADGEMQKLSVVVNRDEVVEADEKFQVHLGAVTGVSADALDQIGVQSTAATGVISNDDSASITISNVTQREDAGGDTADFNFVVSLDATVQDGLTIAYETTDVTASSIDSNAIGDTDFEHRASTVTFGGSAGSRTITVSVRNDDVVEADETFRVVLGRVSGVDATALDDIRIVEDGGVGVIENDDAATITIGNATVDEGAPGDITAAELTVSLSADVQDGLSIGFFTVNGTAIADAGDYRNTTGVLTFAGSRGETQTVSIDVLGDAVVEDAETFSVQLGSVTHIDASVVEDITVSNVAGVVTIKDDDRATVTIADAVVSEGGDADGAALLLFTASLAGEVQDGFSVAYSTADGTATVAGQDFSAVAATVNFVGSDGETILVSIPIVDDDVVEADETLFLRLNSVSGLAAGAISIPAQPAKGVITNDDRAVLSISDTTGFEGTGASSSEFQFVVSLAGEVQDGFTLGYSTADGTATAASGDYTSVAASLDFVGALNETRTLTVQVAHDAIVETDEVFRVLLGTLSNIDPTALDDITVLNTSASATVTNDDVAMLSIDDVLVVEGTSDEPTTALFTVTLGADVQDGLSVEWQTVNGTADHNDFESSSSTLQFVGHQGEQQTVEISIVADDVVEVDDTFEVRLGAISGVDVTAEDDMYVASAGGVGTIRDDDAASLVIADSSVNEGSGGDVNSVEFVLTLNGSIQGGLSASYRTADGSAVSEGDSIGGADYSSVVGDVVFVGTDGEQQRVIVPVFADGIVEPNESFTLVLEGLTGATDEVLSRIALPTVAQGTIVNDDDARLLVEDVSVAEGTDGITTDLVFTVTLDGSVQGGVQLDFATIGDDAQFGQDFESTAGTLSFVGTSGETQNLTVLLYQDDTVEQDESLRVLFSSVRAAAAISFDAQAVGRIINDDVAMFSINDVSSTEGRGVPTEFMFTVTLDSDVDAPLMVDYVTRTDPSHENPATADQDFVASTGTLNFTGVAGEALPLAVIVNADALTELPETFIVELFDPVIDWDAIDSTVPQGELGLAGTEAPSESTSSDSDTTPTSAVTFADAIGVGTIADANGLIVSAAGYGGGPVVRIFNKETRELEKEFLAYHEQFRGGVRLATADVTNDGVPDIITGAGQTGGPHIRVFDGKSGEAVRDFFAYDTQFFGGIWVASADVDNDGFSDIITGPDASGGPHVRVFSGQTGAVLHEFMAYHRGFFGGVRVAAGDINGDGFADIVTAAGPSGGPHVKVFDGRTGDVLQSYFAYDSNFTGGVSITTADFNNDGRSEVVTAPGGGIEATVHVFSELSSVPVTSFLAYERSFTGGVHLSVADVNGDGRFDIVTGTTDGAPRIRSFSGSDQEVVFDRYAFPIEHFSGGIVVGGEITTIPGEMDAALPNE